MEFENVKPLSEVAKYITEKTEVNLLNNKNYISTENMLVNMGGVDKASNLPTIKRVNKFQKQDILFSNIRTYFKKMWFATFDGGSSTDVLTIRKTTDEINNKYLYYFLSQEKFFEYTVVTSKGTKMPRGDKDAIMKFSITIPSFDTQQKIVAILSAFDDKIELNNKMNKTLEEMAKAIFKSWFVDFEPFQDGAFKESELGMIPKGWRVETFENLIEKYIDNRGKTPPITKDGIELAEVNNVKFGFFPIFGNNTKQKYVSEDTYNNWFRAGHPEHLDILMATVGTLPAWCLTPKEKTFSIAQNVIGLRVKKNIITQLYMYLTFNTDNFMEQFNGRIITTAQPSIKIADLKTIKILVPNYETIEKFDKYINDLIARMENNYYEIETLKQNRDVLLPKLMSGEVRV